MPLPKRQAIITSRSANDDRFASFQTDPKYRLPSKKQTKTKLDPRFARLRSDADFHSKAAVDRYGRRMSREAGKKELERMYDLDDEDAHPALAEDPKGRKRDKAVLRELAKVQKKGFDPIRDGGLMSSSEESSSDEDEDEDEEDVEDEAELAGTQGDEVPTGDVTARLAVVNLDWDNIRAADILAVANSFVSAEGRILSVVIYPSEFGMERMQKEELEGPPRDIFSSTSNGNRSDMTSLADLDEESGSDDNEPIKDDLVQESNGGEFDSKALRTYQLDRLRYYYAVISCSSPNVAKSIYDNMDGREYLSSANFFDLRFVPDDTEFDADPHDECETLTDGYKPNEFVTAALSHSKVKLTWDEEDTTRKEVQKRAFSRKEIDENELQAYIGSDSSSSEDEAEDAKDAKANKAASLRAALGLDSSKASSSKTKFSTTKRDRDFEKPNEEMEITFTAGLSATGDKGSVFVNEPEETTAEKYVRKQKERKARRKERALAIKEGRDPNAPSEDKATGAATTGDDADPWNDPFFDSDPEAAKALEKESKRDRKVKRREEREKEEKANAEERAKLELLMVDDEDVQVRHFNMNEILKAEKAKKKGKKKGKYLAETAQADDDGFKINTNDPRFAKLYESHEFAIDPTHPRFQATSGMKAILEEGRKKRKRDRDDGERESSKATKRKDVGQGGDDLKKLAARVKAKSKSS